MDKGIIQEAISRVIDRANKEGNVRQIMGAAKILEVLKNEVDKGFRDLTEKQLAGEVSSVYPLHIVRDIVSAWILEVDPSNMYSFEKRLTTIERGILGVLLTNRNNPVEIAVMNESVWEGEANEINIRTNIYRLRDTLGDDLGNRIKTVRGVGYMYSDSFSNTK